MALLSADNLAKSFGHQDVFSGVSLSIPHRARIAIVGPNGVGKTTLLRLLAGLEGADQGQVRKARDIQIGYLPQGATQSVLGEERLQLKLWDFCVQVFEDIRQREAQLQKLEADMADPKQAKRIMARYGALQEAFERDGGYTYTALIRRVLNGLGLTQETHDLPLASLSGGERTRALLARLLLEAPDLLLLDEPTNHLDLASLEWLETWIKGWNEAVVIVSHDRYFLDRTVDTVLRLSPHGIERYRGNYSSYVQQREERRNLHESHYRAQQEHIRRQEDYIQRNIAGQRSRQAKGRRKRLHRFLQGALDPLTSERSIHIDFGQVDRSGDIVLVAESLKIGYPGADGPLFQTQDLLLTRGACAAIIGPNGAGKTTFLRTLTGEVSPIAGTFRLGASLKIAYFAQGQEDLNPDRSVLEEILDTSPTMTTSEARSFLARFHFTEDEVFKPVAVLSGGERTRIAIAKITLQDANLLLLDEPTNHLDLQSQEVLQQALEGFGGTILMVSHDRYLIDALATQVWSIVPGLGQMLVYDGGYAEYIAEQKQQDVARKTEAPTPDPVPARPVKRSRSVATQLEATEARVQEVEVQLARLMHELEAAGTDVDQVRELGTRYAQAQDELERLLVDWERLSGETSEA